MITGLACNGGTFMATSTKGEILTSVDGTNWITNGVGLPLIDGGSFNIYYNLDLDNPALGETDLPYSTVAAYNGTFLVGSLDGILIQSGNLWQPAQLTTPHAVTGGFSFTFNQQVDVPYHIQASTNLVNWLNVSSGTGSGLPTNYLYTASTNDPARFFRIVSP